MIVKHNNPCGVGDRRRRSRDAYEKALACDPVSAFGGVIAFNRPVDRALAERLNEQFIEVLLAPSYEDGALEVLTQKEAIRILEDSERRGYEPRERDLKRVRGGLLVQDPDRIDETRETMEVGDEGRSRATEQWRRPDVRLEGMPPRALERDRVRQGRGDGRDRGRPDEPGGLGADRGREGARCARRRGWARCSPDRSVASDAFFPFADGPEAAIDGRARRRSSSRAARSATTR